MASYRKRSNGWRVEISVDGQRDSGTFTTKAQAQAWAAQRETELRQQKQTGVVFGKTVRDAFHRYEKEVSRTKRGHRFEALRMAVLAEIEVGEPAMKFGDIKLSDLTTAHVAGLRDARAVCKSVYGIACCFGTHSGVARCLCGPPHGAPPTLLCITNQHALPTH